MGTPEALLSHLRVTFYSCCVSLCLGARPLLNRRNLGKKLLGWAGTSGPKQQTEVSKHATRARAWPAPQLEVILHSSVCYGGLCWSRNSGRNGPQFQEPKKSINIKNLGRTPPSQTPRNGPLTPQFFMLGASFPFRIQEKGPHKEF